MRRFAAVLLFLTLAACGDPSEQQLKSARSWSATALVVARGWERGELPAAYADRTLQKAADELAKGPLPHAADAVDELRTALERNDHAAARRLLDELAGQ